jgi:tRNA threonylcarbamoyladenosine biosynthesis protein TsaB
VIFVIDTSASTAAVAMIDAANGVREEVFAPKGPGLLPLLRRIARLHTITKVAVVTGPGSFTGLRVGVSFGLGLAMGLRIPIVPLPTLELQAARSDEPVTAIVEAGRGRFYYLVPGGDVALGAPVEIPTSHELVGRLEDRSALIAAGHRFRPEGRLLPFVKAAEKLLETAREVAYGSLEIKYMQTFSAQHR